MVFYGMPSCHICGAHPFSEPKCVCLHITRWRNARESGIDMDRYWELNDDKDAQYELIIEQGKRDRGELTTQEPAEGFA